MLFRHREKHPACKNWVMRCWHCYLSGARCKWFTYGPADVSCFIEIQIGLTFPMSAYPGCIWKVAVKRVSVSLRPVYTIQTVVKPVEQLVEQPAASCKQTFNRLSNRLFNRFDNRLYRVNGVWAPSFNGTPTLAPLKPNSITLSGSKLVQSWSQTGSKLVRCWLQTCNELKFGLSCSLLAAN